MGSCGLSAWLSQTRYMYRWKYVNSRGRKGENRRGGTKEKRERMKGEREWGREKGRIERGVKGGTLTSMSIMMSIKQTDGIYLIKILIKINKQLKSVMGLLFLQWSYNFHSHFSWQFIVLVRSTLVPIFSARLLLCITKERHTSKATVNVLTL